MTQLYGLGIAIDREKYSEASGYDRFKKDLLSRLSADLERSMKTNLLEAFKLMQDATRRDIKAQQIAILWFPLRH